MRKLRSEIKRLRQSQFARNAGWMFAGQGAGYFLQAAYFVVLARVLGATEYGIFGGAFALAALVAQYSTLGTGMVFMRYVSGDPGAFSRYWGNLLLVTLGFGSVLSFLLVVLAPRLLNPESAKLVLMAAIANCICAQLTTEVGRVFQAYEKMKITAGLNLLTNALRTITATGMLIFVHHANAMQWAIASMTVSVFASVLALILVHTMLGSPSLDLRVTKTHLGEGVGYSFAASTSAAYNDLDKTMLSHYGLNHDNGIYTMAYRLVDIATMPISSLHLAAIPTLFREGKKGLAAVLLVTNRLLKRAAPLGLVMAAALFLLAPIAPHVVGKGFIESVSAIRWLCLIPLLRAAHQLNGWALTGAGRQNYRTAAQLFAAGFNFALNLYLIPRHGWLGAAWASLATDGALVVIIWLIIQLVLWREHAQSHA